MKGEYDVVIIGGGMGGLSCGAWLANHGMKVAVIEQNEQVGGFCSSYKRNGFNFTLAASEVTGTIAPEATNEKSWGPLAMSPALPETSIVHNPTAGDWTNTFSTICTSFFRISI